MRLSVEVSTIVHATEVLDRVLRAVRNTAPADLWPEIERSMEIMDLEGHYGNPLKRIKIRLGGRAAEELARHIMSRLEKADFETLVLTLHRRFDPRESRLYIRFSKQDAYMGRIKCLDGDDVIRVVITIPGVKSSENVEKLLRDLRGGS